MDLYDKFKLIEAHYAELDAIMREKDIKLHFDTSYGIWGPSSMLDLFELFIKLRLDERRGFVDLGSGDGRIVLIAALFTDATGIEGETKLDEKANEIRNLLAKRIPELKRATFIHSDYTKEDLSRFEILFTFCDHPWDERFEEKMQRECKGVLLSYNKIFLPKKLKKGKTYWMQQLPIVTYWLNIPESELARPLALDQDEHDEDDDRNGDEHIGAV